MTVSGGSRLSGSPVRGGGLELLHQARHQAERLDNLVRALQLVAAASVSEDPEVRFHLGRLLGWLADRIRPHHAPEELLARPWLPADLSRELGRLLERTRDRPEIAAATKRSEVGAVTALLWDADQSREAFLARLSVESVAVSPRVRPHRCGAAFAAALARAEYVVFNILVDRGQLRTSATLLEGVRIALSGPSAAGYVVMDGGSIGAAAAVAFFSRWTGRAVPADIAITGVVDISGRILPVEALQEKVEAALRERPRLRAVIVPAPFPPVGSVPDSSPAGQDPRVRPVDTVTELLEEVFGTDALDAPCAAAVDIEGSVKLGVELYEKANNFPVALGVLKATLRSISQRRTETDASLHRPDELICRWRAGSCLIHLGDPELAADWLEQARKLGEELWRAGEIDPRVYCGLRGTHAGLLRDLFRYDQASDLLEETLALQRQLRQDKRELARTLGNLGELWTFMGRYQDAETALTEALEALKRVYPDEVPRELCYLGNLALHQGDASRAAELFAGGLAQNREVEHGRQMNEAFLRYGLVRALLARGCTEAVIHHCRLPLSRLPVDAPYPRQLILKQRGVARLTLGDREGGSADLLAAADLSFASGGLLRFGLSTALAELSISLLRSPAEEGRALAAEYARRFATIAEQTPGLTAAEGLAERIEELVGPPIQAEALIQILEEVAGRFPY